MKKRLEAELISIAHRVLKLKNKSEVDQLFIETQKLYEALSVLKFYGDHIDQVKETISQEDLEEKLADSLDAKAEPAPKEIKAEIAAAAKQVVDADEESEVTETKVVAVEEEAKGKSKKEVVAVDEESAPAEIKVVAVEQEEESEEEPDTSDSELAKHIVGEINIDEDDDIEEVAAESNDAKEEEGGFDPIFEMASEKMEEEPVAEVEPIEEKSKTQQISFEHLLGEDYKEPEFVKPNDISTPPPTTRANSELSEAKAQKVEEHTEVLVDKKEDKSANLNEKFASGINIGLNDRIGFVKYLFDNSTEDYNRVLSQLNTFSTYADAKEFIDEMVKPDYNNWVGQEEFAERFMDIVEKKFA